MKGMFAPQALQQENIVTLVVILPTLQANPPAHQLAILVMQENIALGMEEKKIAAMAITLQVMPLSALQPMPVNLRQATARLHNQTQLLISGLLLVISKKETAQEEKYAMEVLVKHHVLQVVIVQKVPLLHQALEWSKMKEDYGTQSHVPQEKFVHRVVPQ